MPNDKLKLPTTVPSTGSAPASESVQREMLRTQRAGIDASAKVEVARLQVAKEAIAAAKAFFDVLRSYNELEATRVEWENRVAVAETAVKQAEAELEVVRERNKTRLVELEHLQAAQDRLLTLFDDVMREVADAQLSPETKAARRQFLLELSDRIVKLRA